MPCLTVEIGLRYPQSLDRKLVVTRLLGGEQWISAHLQQAGVDHGLDRLDRAAAGRQKQHTDCR